MQMTFYGKINLIHLFFFLNVSCKSYENFSNTFRILLLNFIFSCDGKRYPDEICRKCLNRQSRKHIIKLKFHFQQLPAIDGNVFKHPCV